MKNPLDELLAAAKTITLDEGERRAMAQTLGIRVRERNAERPQQHMGSTQFFRAGKKVSLSPSEKAMSKEYVLHRLEQRRSPWWTFSLKSLTAVMAALLIVIIGGSGVSYAAESALPGDFLYPVKIHVNEEVKGRMLMKDSESAARWQATRAERRLKEAETLARNATLTEDARLVLAENFRKHSRAVQADILSLQAENNDAAGAIGMDFEAVLRAHARLLGSLGEERSDQLATIDALMDDVHEARMEAEELNVLATLKKTPVANTVLTDSTLNRARAEVALAEKRMNKNPSPAIGNTLSAAREALAAAEETTNVEERMKKARSALRTAKEIELLSTVPNGRAAVNVDTKVDSNDSAVRTQKIRAENDTAFSAEVRMRITKRALEKLGEDMKNDEPMTEEAALRTETQIMGAKQLLDIAKIQMEAGEDSHALEASDMALKHAEEAKAEVEIHGKTNVDKD